MVLEKGVFNRIDGRRVGILDKDCVEESSGVTFGTFQLLGNEHGLFGEICVDHHRLSTDSSSAYLGDWDCVREREGVTNAPDSSSCRSWGLCGPT